MRISDWSSDVCSSDLLLSEDMVARFPESLRARRLNRLWRVTNKAAFQLRSQFGFGGGNPLTGHRARGVEAVSYSPPLPYDCLVFAAAGHASVRSVEGRVEHERASEGH